MLDGLLPGADRDLVSHLSKRLKGKFDEIMLRSKVVEMKEEKNEIKVKIEDDNGNLADKSYDYVLMSVGRKPMILIFMQSVILSANRCWLIKHHTKDEQRLKQ